MADLRCVPYPIPMHGSGFFCGHNKSDFKHNVFINACTISFLSLSPAVR